MPVLYPPSLDTIGRERDLTLKNISAWLCRSESLREHRCICVLFPTPQEAEVNCKVVSYHLFRSQLHFSVVLNAEKGLP